jgi:hypothetical protein
MGLISAGRRTPAITLVLMMLAAASSPQAFGKASFEPTLEFTGETRTYRMTLTGQAERKFLFFRVYDIAHYADSTMDPSDLTPETVIVDGPAKALSIHFARTLSMKRVREELRSSIQRNAQPQWLERAERTIDRFLASIDRDAEAGDRLVYYWLPGGRIHAAFNGEVLFTAKDVLFAKLIWLIWFGDDPACDRDALLALSDDDEADL